jgi:hypothetical protein
MKFSSIIFVDHYTESVSFDACVSVSVFSVFTQCPLQAAVTMIIRKSIQGILFVSKLTHKQQS